MQRKSTSRLKTVSFFFSNNFGFMVFVMILGLIADHNVSNAIMENQRREKKFIVDSTIAATIHLFGGQDNWEEEI
jgi:hypothetical protein